MKSPENIAVTPTAYAYPLIIKQLLLSTLSFSPEQEIVYADKGRYTYREFHTRLHRFGNLLASLGLKGETVAFMDWDTPRYLEAFFAVPMVGSVLMTTNVRLSPEQILYTLNHSEAKALFINAEFLPILEGIRDRLESVEVFILLSDSTDTLIPEGFQGEYESLLAISLAECQFPDLDENCRATTFYTTGTTGLPKGVYFSHRQLVLHTLSVVATLGSAPQQGRLHRDDVYMPLTPMFHVHAWGIPYAATLMGIKQVYPGRYIPDTILGLIEKEGVTFSHCVPTILHMLLTLSMGGQVDLSRWKVIIGGSLLSSALAEAALARGIDIFSGYGMSETCPVLSVAQIDAHDGQDTSTGLRTKAGRPIFLVDLQIATPEMEILSHDGQSVGEVVVRAPWLTQGYLNNGEASESLWEGGYLHTQDIGKIDAAGYLQVTDRIKDVIKSGGEWISSLELENIIIHHPDVCEAAVIGVEDDKWGERPLVFVVLKPGKYANAESIRRFVKTYADQGCISRYGVPEQVLFVESLARTSVGKINKQAMREKVAIKRSTI